MKAINSILVVVDRGLAARDAVSKAVLLGRQFGAQVKLFTCDAECGFSLSQAFVPRGVEAARQATIEVAQLYLDELRRSVDTTDVAITIDASCESPLYESIVRKVMRERPDLVIKSVAGTGALGLMHFDATDWQLMRTCPATLMLTRGRAWRAPPQFGAAIDASAGESVGLAGEILGAAELLARCAHGGLDIVYAEPLELGDVEREQGTQTLYELARKQRHLSPTVHVLAGNPEVSLPAFAKRRRYDALFLGALAHRPGLTTQVGTLTSRLVEVLDCDFILVKPAEYRTPITESCATARITAPSQI
jgi:universal stress protein E